MAERNARVLVVEDDAAIRRGIAINLRSEGYEVLEAARGDDGLQLATEQLPDLIVLDIMLPGLSGLQLLEAVREADMDLPVIILSARDRLPEKLEGLASGADDYMTKPFSIKELLARVNAHLRRARRTRPKRMHVRFGDVLVDREARTVMRGGEDLHLSPKAYALLEHLIETAGRAQTREHLLTRVWGWDYEGTPRTVDNFVRAVRTAIEPDPDEPIYLVTVRGVGYRLDVPPEDEPRS